MEEYIGQVKLNYNFYTGKDFYSDGDIEDELLEVVKEKKNYEKIISETDKFAVFYHLSDIRKFICEPMDIDKSDLILEIGSGCGAITGRLADMGKSVECVELSKRRSMINAYRNAEKNNIEIIVGNYENIRLVKKYNIITLIGVFEYANSYFHSDTPYEDFLLDVWRKLADGGKLYIAIENRLGAKYFAGCGEDHAGKISEGLEGYPDFKMAKTFSYYEWLDLLKKCGINNYKFYYPYPDYKFPRVIYSDNCLPSKNDSFERASNYSSKRRVFFDEAKFYKSLVLEKEFKIFSNSFLIELRK